MRNKQPKKNTSRKDWLECDVEYLVENNILFKPLDGNHGGIHPKSSDFVASGIPFVMASDVHDFKVDLTNCNFISKAQAGKLQKGFSIESDVLFTHKGSVGGTAIVPVIKTDYIMLTPQVTYYRVRDINKLNNYFIFSYFQSDWFQNYVKTVSGGGTRAYIGITAQLALPFILPPLTEQKRIVLILETWDKAIEKLTQKIKTKKQIKKALLHDLLSGKNRLSGFNNKWEVVMLGSVCKIKTGKKDVNEGNSNGRYPFFTCARTHTYSDDYSFDTEAILIAGNGDVGNCQYYKGKFEAYQRTYVLSGFTKNVQYIFSYLNYFFQNTINSQKQMGAMPYIKLGMLQDYEIRIPSSQEEQEAIAKILITADKEITELKNKLSIFKEQKRYLLNNLITGKIRTPETLSAPLTK